jgi:hypothetical protein
MNVQKVYVDSSAKITLPTESYLIGDFKDLTITDAEGKIIKASVTRKYGVTLVYPLGGTYPLTVSFDKPSLSFIV